MLRRAFLRSAPKKKQPSASGVLKAHKNELVPTVSTDGSYVIMPSVSTLHGSSSPAAAKPPSSFSTAALPVPWLLDNCLSRRHATGQKTTNLFNERSGDNRARHARLPSVVAAAVVPLEGGSSGGKLSSGSSSGEPNPIEQILEVTLSDKTKASVPVAAIEAFLFDKSRGAEGAAGRMLVPPALRTAAQIHRVDFAPFVEHLQLGTPEALRDTALFKMGTAEHYAALRRLALDGIIIVRGCGLGEGAVTTVAAACGSFVMPTLYGTDWHVASTPQEGSKNIAYTAARLDLHQDLAYHESMPGIQLLHCQRFKKSVVGGNTFFVDSLAVVEAFRHRHPAEFKVFTEVPVAFIKDDFERPLPAQYYYATPHIHLNDRGEVNKVFWAPSFEAPVPMEGQRCAEYYAARAAFCDVLHEFCESSSLSIRLAEGECVVWQQVRLWHGRESFTEKEPQSRVFHGAYANIDQFRCNVVAKGILHNDPTTPTLLNFMNRSFR